MSLQFLHTVLLWGMGLVLLPVLIHMLRRRLVRRHRLPTFEFLLRTQRRITSRSRLKNWILLALRISAVGLAVFLASRPLLETAGGMSGSGWSPLHLVIVLDNSASMRYRTARGTRFEVAKRAATRMIEGLSGADAASVIPTVGLPEEGQAPAEGRDAALARLAAVEQTDAAGAPARALRRAMESLTAPADRRSVVVLSDFSRSDWERFGLTGLRRLRPHARLQFVRVAPEAGTDDLALRDVHLRPWPPRAGAPFAAVVRVANRGAARAEGVPVSLRIGDEKVAESELTVPAGAEATVSFRVKAPERGSLLGRVELGADPLSATNRFFFAAEMGQRLRALIVDGDPKRGLLDSETFYIASALRAAPPGGDSPILVDVVAGYELGRVRWEDYDFAVACNVARWPGDAAEALRRFVEGGGGLLLAGGDLAGRTVPGGGWLPAELGEPRTLEPPQGVALARGAADHPVFGMLGSQAGRFLRRIRVGRASPLAPGPGGKALLGLADGTPLLVVGAAGAGRVAVWGSSCDRDWTDFAVRPAFVPFLRGLVDFIGSRARGAASALEAGRPLEVRAPARRAGEAVQVRTPSGGEVSLRLEAGLPEGRGGRPRAGAARARFADTFEAGFYRVLTSEGAYTVAVNVPRSEAQLEPVGEAELRERLPGLDMAMRSLPGDEKKDSAPSLLGRMDLGAFLFLALAAMLVVEGAVADRS